MVHFSESPAQSTSAPSSNLTQMATENSPVRFLHVRNGPCYGANKYTIRGKGEQNNWTSGRMFGRALNGRNSVFVGG